MLGDEPARRHDASSIDLGPHFGICGELAPHLPQQLCEPMLERRGLSPLRSPRTGRSGLVRIERAQHARSELASTRSIEARRCARRARMVFNPELLAASIA